jgi:transcriptional regulator with XRE-family HTH domain
MVAAKPSGTIKSLENLPSTLREVRRIRGVSMREVAAQSGTSYKTVGRIEQGHDCAVSSALAVMRWIEGA